MSKHNQIKNHLLSGLTITGLEAIKMYGLYRLSSVINRLRDEGLAIKTVMVNSEDGKSLFAKYFIPIHERKN